MKTASIIKNVCIYLFPLLCFFLLSDPAEAKWYCQPDDTTAGSQLERLKEYTGPGSKDFFAALELIARLILALEDGKIEEAKRSQKSAIEYLSRALNGYLKASDITSSPTLASRLAAVNIREISRFSSVPVGDQTFKPLERLNAAFITPTVIKRTFIEICVRPISELHDALRQLIPGVEDGTTNLLRLWSNSITSGLIGSGWLRLSFR